MERLVVDLAGAMQPDQLGPPRFHRRDDDVEMARDRQVALFRGAVECLARGGARMIAAEALGMDDLSVGVMGLALVPAYRT